MIGHARCCALLAGLHCAASALASEASQASELAGRPGAVEPARAGEQDAAPPSPQGEDGDLERIPAGAQQPLGQEPPAQARAANQRVYLEQALSLSSLRADLAVPFPQPAPSGWQERLFLDVRREWSLGARVSLTQSARVNLRAEDGIAFPSGGNVLTELRETIVSWEPLDRTYVDVGRINLKSGTALGFNPTDFFRARAVVQPLSADPSVLREDRLGTLMVRVQHLWDGGAVAAAFAPGLYRQTAIQSETKLPSVDPSFDRTNAVDRALLKATASVGIDLEPEFLVYLEGGRAKAGASVSRSLGRSVVAYAEWAGGEEAGLVHEALHYGRQTGTLPPAAPSPIPEDPRVHFRNDLSVGGSYSSEAKVTVNLEYHLHEAGFSSRDWDAWFAAGGNASASSPVVRELWFIRAYALDQQVPATRHSLFLRAAWSDAVVRHLELSGFVNLDVHDGSALAQLTADYDVSSTWTLGVQMSGGPGARRSDFGSLPQSGSVLLRIAGYL